MAAADGPGFDWVVVWHQSRIWRNRRERADGIERLKTAQVSLAAVKGPDLDLTTAQGRMLAGLLGEVDTAEVEIKGERQAAAGLQSAQQGRPTGGAPTVWLPGRRHGGRSARGGGDPGLHVSSARGPVARRRRA